MCSEFMTVFPMAAVVVALSLTAAATQDRRRHQRLCRGPCHHPGYSGHRYRTDVDDAGALAMLHALANRVRRAFWRS